MNPAHGAFNNPLCFTVEGEIVVTDGTKVGCRELTVTGTFELPVCTPVQIAAFGILCALAGYSEESFKVWATNWLNGLDRTAYAASNASNATSNAASNAAAAAADYIAATAADYTAIAACKIPINFQDLAEQAMEIK
jgi:hypothetical protein